MRKLVIALTGLALVVITAACGSDAAEPAPTTAPSAPPATESSVAPAPPTLPPGGGGGGTAVRPRPASSWTSGPLVVRHAVTVPPVPRVTGIRSAAHPQEGYDRVVLDLAGPIPGYRVSYVDQPIQDGSGLPANVPGRRSLQMTLEPAQAHTDGGVAAQPRARTVNHPMLEAWAITGDFEGVVTVVLGVDDVVGYRVGELPGRIYIDVAA
jgi:hypothetical protein